jgi:multidrug efflux pump subunit AcrA (membrane-fusion protein)
VKNRGRPPRPALAFVAALGMALSIGCRSTPRPESTEAASTPVVVSIAPVAVVDLPSRIEAGGVVQASATAHITSRVLAPIQVVHVRAGDRVSRGQTLVTLDARELSANAERAAAALTAAVEASRAAESRAASAEAALRLAAATHDRINALYAKRSATPQELDQAVAAQGSADAQLKAARAESASAAAARDAARAASDGAAIARSYAAIVAPFDGIVADRTADPGSLATPGAPLLVVEQLGSARLEVRLDESRAARVAVGQRAEVQLDAVDPARWLPATIVEAGRADPVSHSLLVKLELPSDTSARTGSFGRARFVVDSRHSLTVPASAVIRRAGLTFVFTVDASNHARLRPVVVGAIEGQRAEVLAGAAPDEAVIVSPPPSLADGALVASSSAASANNNRNASHE